MTDMRSTPEFPRPGIGADAFVSYARKDQAAVRRLALAMRDRGRTLWVDWEGIAPTAEWMAEIREAIYAADAVVFVLSPTSLGSRVCGEELAYAQDAHKKIVPLVVAEVEPSEVPAELAKLNWLFLRDTDDVDLLADQLVEVLDKDLESVKLHTRLTVHAAEWTTAGRGPARLLRGSDLAEAERWLESPGKGPAPTAMQTQYVVASHQAASRRQRIVTATVSVALVVALALGGFSVVQRQAAIEKRDLSRTQALASAALAQVDRDPETSLLLALEATKSGRTPLVEEALRRSVLASQVVNTFVPAARNQSTGRVAFSSDGRILYATSNLGRFIGDSRTGRLVSYDLRTGRRLRAVSVPIGNFNLQGLAVIGPRRLVVGADTVYFLDPISGKTIPLPEQAAPHGYVCYNVAVTRDRKAVFTASEDGMAREINAATGALVRTFGAGHGEIYDAQPSPDGETLAVAGVDGIVRLYGRHDGRPRGTLPVGSAGIVAQWSPSGRYILTTSQDRLARVWDVRTRTVANQMGHSGLVNDATWAGTDDYVATVDGVGVGRVWDVGSGDVLTELRGHTTWINFVVASPDGRRLATASQDGTVRVWRLGPGAPAGRHNTTETVNGVDVTDDGRRVVSASYVDGTVLSDARTGRTIRVLDKDATEAPRLSPDGATVATLVVEGTHPAVRLRDVRTGRLIWELSDFGDRHTLPHAAGFSPDGTRLAIHTRAGALLLDTRDGRILRSYGAESSLNDLPEVLRVFGHDGDVEWTPDGKLIAIPHGADIVLLDGNDLTERARLHPHGGAVLGLAITPDGRELLSVSPDQTARIWRLRDGRELQRLQLGTIAVGIAVSPAGYVATTGLDGYLRVWNPKGLEVMRTRVATTMANRVRFTPDGRHLLVGIGLGFDEQVGLGSPAGLRKSGAFSIIDCEVCRSYRQLIKLARSRVTHPLPADVRAAALGEG
jgi:WD40 repeat protein